MSSSTITVVGLGPGRRASLTVEALDALRAATLLYLTTAALPMLDELGGDLRPDARIQSLDEAAGLAARLIEESGSAPVYAVPGHPLIGNASVRLLLQQAGLHDVTVRLIAGLSPMEPVLSALGLDPFTGGLQIVAAAVAGASAPSAAEGLAPLWEGASSRLLNAQLPLLIDGVATADLLATVAGRLLERYPAAHPVTLVHDAGTGRERVEQVPLDALASADGGDLIPCALSVPPLAPLDDLRAPNALGYITARLRGPGGCPWDREQTHASLTPYMIEEAYEAVDAIERADVADTVEELGDVLLQVVLHSQLAEEEGRFALADVAAEVNAKLVRRHPHVFGDVIGQWVV